MKTDFDEMNNKAYWDIRWQIREQARGLINKQSYWLVYWQVREQVRWQVREPVWDQLKGKSNED